MSSTEIKAAAEEILQRFCYLTCEKRLAEYRSADLTREFAAIITRNLTPAGAEEVAREAAEKYLSLYPYLSDGPESVEYKTKQLADFLLSAIHKARPEIAETEVGMEKLVEGLRLIFAWHDVVKQQCGPIPSPHGIEAARAALAHAEEVLKPHEEVHPEGPQTERRCGKCRFWSTNMGAKKGTCSKGGLSTEWKQVCELGFMPRAEVRPES